jgi:hypothetical protein
MTTKFRSILLVAAIAMLASVAMGASDFALDKAVSDQMNKEAREAYDQSQAYLDKVNYPAALDSLIVASEKQPDMAELCFLVGAFACNEARKHMGEDAISVLHKAENAYEKVLDTQCFGNLRHADRQFAETALAKVKVAIATEADRDARIAKVAQTVIQSDKDLIAKLRAARAAELAAQAANGTLPPGQGANGMAPAAGAGNPGLAGALNNAVRGTGASVSGANMGGGAVVGGRPSMSGNGTSSPSNNGGGARRGGGTRG